MLVCPAQYCSVTICSFCTQSLTQPYKGQCSLTVSCAQRTWVSLFLTIIQKPFPLFPKFKWQQWCETALSWRNMWCIDMEMSTSCASVKVAEFCTATLKWALALCGACVQLAKILPVFPSLLEVDLQILQYLTSLHVKLDRIILLPFSCEVATCR